MEKEWADVVTIINWIGQEKGWEYWIG